MLHSVRGGSRWINQPRCSFLGYELSWHCSFCSTPLFHGFSGLWKDLWSPCLDSWYAGDVHLKAMHTCIFVGKVFPGTVDPWRSAASTGKESTVGRVMDPYRNSHTAPSGDILAASCTRALAELRSHLFKEANLKLRACSSFLKCHGGFIFLSVMVVCRYQEKPRGSGHPRPASFLMLMIDRDELPSAAQIDLSAELCLPPKPGSPNCFCHEMSCERSKRRFPYIVMMRCCSNHCQIFTPYCRFYYYCFIYLAGPEVGTYIFNLTLASPGHIPLYLFPSSYFYSCK